MLCAGQRGDWARLDELTDHPVALDSVEWRLLMPRLYAECQRGHEDQALATLALLEAIATGGVLETGSGRLQVVRGLGLDLDMSGFVEAQEENYQNLKLELAPRMSYMRNAAIKMVWDGDLTGARVLYGDLTPSSGWFNYHGREVCDRNLGYLAWKIGEPEFANRHYQHAIDFCRSNGFTVEQAWCCAEFAEFLLERDDPGDSDKVTEFQDEAIAIATELGMQPLLERVLAQREILKA
jgi:hypothetical protein